MENEPLIPNNDLVIIEKRGNRRIRYSVTKNGEIRNEYDTSTKYKSNYGLNYLIKNIFQELFLPRGYPSSVSSDYLDYQIWDTVQGFCSTVNGTLSTHAIFKGVGVGDHDATALAATVTWILKDGTGMIGRIVFAWLKGSSLDSDCKKWRFAADVSNDTAMGIELLLGAAFLKSYGPFILSIATFMKAIVGVAGGSTRAAITQHQAVKGNMADVSAKDGSQETCVNLLGSLVGLCILSYIEQSVWKVWVLFVISTTVHLFANYKAVKHLNLTTLNNSRMVLLMKYFCKYDVAAIPKIINRDESVLLGFGLSEMDLCSMKINLGCSLKDLTKSSGRSTFCVDEWRSTIEKYSSFPYKISLDGDKKINVILPNAILDKDIVMAYFHALVLGIIINRGQILESVSSLGEKFCLLLKEYSRTNNAENCANKFVLDNWSYFVESISSNGWNLESHQLIVGESRINLNN